MATHSSILAWEIPRTEASGELQSMGLQSVRCDSHFHFFFFSIILHLFQHYGILDLYWEVQISHIFMS